MIAAKTCAGQQRKLAVAALQPLIAEIFKISRFDLVLSIYPTIEDALQAISPDGKEG
jgi:anti-anti-sigma regulatory factor